MRTMGHKKKGRSPGKLPEGNRTHFGPGADAGPPTADDEAPGSPGDGTGDAEQDPKRRLGNFVGKGEHSFVQPGGKNDAQRSSRKK